MSAANSPLGESGRSAGSAARRVLPIAFYLPQFHPIPENDAWWGRGFTEWTNVKQGTPLFSGHYQPHVPADLGYYDLRSAETRNSQAKLAEEYGIHGFCYYHYWFSGTRLLHRPLDEVIASREPDFPFCLCWANENWTRAWDGRDSEVLIEQRYADSDDRDHIRWLGRAFRDQRYIRIDGKPLFLVYRASNLPNPLKTTSIWREEAQKMGVGELYLCRVESFADDHSDPVALGFDAGVEFQPDWTALGRRLKSRKYEGHNVFLYSDIVKRMLDRALPHYKRFPCVTPSWDNSVRRRSGAVVFLDSTPDLYEKWLRGVIRMIDPDGERIVFINAWNEWGEGNHLEPDLKFGRGYLEATRSAISNPADESIVAQRE